MASVEWVDLLDPDEATLRAHFDGRLHPLALDNLTAPAVHADDPRPKLESHGNYVFGILLVPVEVPTEDRVYYQEIDLVLTEALVLTVRKTPERGEPIDLSDVRSEGHGQLTAGMLAYRIFDQVAEAFLDLVDDLHDEVDELEDHVEEWSNNVVRHRLSDLRHDLLHIRKTLAPTRDAARRVVDDRVELDDGELFARDVELHFGDTYDKLLRANDGLESARDLIAGVRDYHQSKISNDQNEVMKRLTAVASILLLPTFIVGLYGQNFKHIPELGWAQGYGFSWLLIVTTTLVQLWYFRRKQWI
ncbi:MAG TPA: magnesium transporter CorA family protein [Acidimicrobiia bacterium]|jgi:magnesium transporter|nr:magnesium transporter CorA family protein [Acidimicrobiia bacterium]